MKIVNYKAVPVSKVSAVEDQGNGIVRALVSVTGIKDNVGDIIHPGSYTKTLRTRMPKGVWHHDVTKAVSRTLTIEEMMPGHKELPKTMPDGSPWPAEAGGLMVETEFNLKSTRGRDAYEDVKFFGTDQEWSIGFNVPKGKATVDQKTGIRHIKEVDLFEYSPVLFGAMPIARSMGDLTEVKSAQQIWKTFASLEDLEVKSLMQEVAAEQAMEYKDFLSSKSGHDETKKRPVPPWMKPKDNDSEDDSEDDKDEDDKKKPWEKDKKSDDKPWDGEEDEEESPDDDEEDDDETDEEKAERTVQSEAGARRYGKKIGDKYGSGGSGGKYMEEDESPAKGRHGGKLVDYEGGVARYSDGSVYNGSRWVSTVAKKKKPHRMEEDESPAKGRNGGKLVSYSNGVARYSDGSSTDGRTWSRRTPNGKKPSEKSDDFFDHDDHDDYDDETKRDEFLVNFKNVDVVDRAIDALVDLKNAMLVDFRKDDDFEEEDTPDDTSEGDEDLSALVEKAGLDVGSSVTDFESAIDSEDREGAESAAASIVTAIEGAIDGADDEKTAVLTLIADEIETQLGTLPEGEDNQSTDENKPVDDEKVSDTDKPDEKSDVLKMEMKDFPFAQYM